MKLIDKDTLVAEIKKRKKEAESNCGGYKSYDEYRCDACIVGFYEEFLEILDILEVKDPYEECIQYSNIETGIKAYAETYSFNIESKLFHQLTKEQQALWRKEIEQACISGGDAGVELARDPRYEENLEVKNAFIEKACEYFRRSLENTKVIDEYRDIVVRGIQASYTSVEEFIEDFKNYMKGE